MSMLQVNTHLNNSILVPGIETPVDISFGAFYLLDPDSPRKAASFQIVSKLLGQIQKAFSLNIFRMHDNKNVALTGYQIKEGDQIGLTPEANEIAAMAKKIDDRVTQALKLWDIENLSDKKADKAAKTDNKRVSKRASIDINKQMFNKMMTEYQLHLCFRTVARDIFYEHTSLTKRTIRLLDSVEPEALEQLPDLKKTINICLKSLISETKSLQEIEPDLVYELPLNTLPDQVQHEILSWNQLTPDLFHSLVEKLAETMPHIYLENNEFMKFRGKVESKEDVRRMDALFQANNVQALLNLWKAYPLHPNVKKEYLEQYNHKILAIYAKIKSTDALYLSLDKCLLTLCRLNSGSQQEFIRCCEKAKNELGISGSSDTYFDRLKNYGLTQEAGDYSLLAKYALLVALICLSDRVTMPLPVSELGIQSLLRLLDDRNPMLLMDRTLKVFNEWKALSQRKKSKDLSLPEANLGEDHLLMKHAKSNSAPIILAEELAPPLPVGGFNPKFRSKSFYHFGPEELPVWDPEVMPNESGSFIIQDFTKAK